MGYMRMRINMNDWGISAKLIGGAKKAEHAMAIQAAKDTEQFVPKLGGVLRTTTRVVGNTIIYPGPYARYLYYGKKMVDAATGRGPMNIPNVGYRYKKGAVLTPTNEDLQLAHAGTDPHAQAFWFEASKGENLDKWMKVAAKAVEQYDGK